MRSGRLGQKEAHEGKGQAGAAAHDVVAVLPRRAQALQQLVQPRARQLVQLRARLPQQPASSVMVTQKLDNGSGHCGPNYCPL